MRCMIEVQGSGLDRYTACAKRSASDVISIMNKGRIVVRTVSEPEGRESVTVSHESPDIPIRADISEGTQVGTRFVHEVHASCVWIWSYPTPA